MTSSKCLVAIFGASGDLTKRLLIPAFYNLACSGLLPEEFAIAGIAMDDLTTEQFRERMSRDIRTFSTREEFDPAAWEWLCSRLYYAPGRFDDADAYARLGAILGQLDERYGTEGNVVFYMATPPVVFGMISSRLEAAGLSRAARGFRRIIVEKPFGADLTSAVELNREILRYWTEDQVYRIDHYLGKETVQNIIAFRFANGMFEPMWNRNYIDHIQFGVAESVGVEGRGGYYEKAGVLRDMLQNHMFQMLAYLCMEPPASFAPEAVRNEKAKLLEAVRVMKPEEVASNVVRGQYVAGRGPDGSPVVGYRSEPNVAADSSTETFLAARLFIDNWRWMGVPIYLRSGKRLWKRGAEIVVQLKQPPSVLFRGTQVDSLDANRLIFHVQPDQGIELRFQAKRPGPGMALQDVNMRFDYRDAFSGPRAIGYEVLLHNCMNGDATLFSRTDLVETAWRIAQPMLDAWRGDAPPPLSEYPAGSWGPKAAYELMQRDGRSWVEVLNWESLRRVPLFEDAGEVLLRSLALELRPAVFQAGDVILRKGDVGGEMYFVARGEVEVLGGDAADQVVATLGEGDFFGEAALLHSAPRNATVRAKSYCDLFALEKASFDRVLAERPSLAAAVRRTAESRYPR